MRCAHPSPEMFMSSLTSLRCIYTRGARRAVLILIALASAFLLPVTIRAQEISGPNLLDNPDFAHGLQSWKLEVVPPAAALIDGLPESAAPPRAASRGVRVNVSAIGAEKWHV